MHLLGHGEMQTLLHYKVWRIGARFGRLSRAVTPLRLLNAFNLFIAVLFAGSLPAWNFWQFVSAAVAVACGVGFVRDTREVWRAWKG